MIDQPEKVPRACLSQHCGNALIKSRRVAEATPNFIPFSAALKQRIGGRLRAVMIRIKTEIAHADVAKCCPSTRIAARLKCISLAHPTEQVADWIADGQPIKIVGFKA